MNEERKDIALNLEGAKVGPVILRNGFKAQGEARLYVAVINGTIECDGGQFLNPDGIALNLEGVTSNAILLRNNFPAEGKASLDYSVTRVRSSI